jgi:hypothetical protein
MAESSLPNPIISIVSFLIITLFFVFFNVFNINQTKTIINASTAINNDGTNIVYILLVVLISFFINATISKAMCSQSIQWGYILMITLLPWIIIFISLHVILTYIFPGWISPFSNTIGYIVIGFMGVDKVYDSIFKTGEEASGNKELIKAIANMNSNRTKFINQINTNINDFNTFFNSMKDAVKTDDKKYNDYLLELYKLLIIKKFVGKIVWYILAGILISSISYNLVISRTCEKSLEEIKKNFADAKIAVDAKAAEASLINTAPPPIETPVGQSINTPLFENTTASVSQALTGQ